MTWGLELHEELGHCLFCAGAVTSERRTQLSRHFDESWLQIRGMAKDLLGAVTREKQMLSAWHSNLPAAGSLVGDLQPAYSQALGKAKAEVDERVATLEAVEVALGAKVDDPSATPEAPDWSVLVSAPSITVLGQAVAEHNDQVRRHSEVTTGRKQTVLDHLVGSQSEAFCGLEEKAEELGDKSIASTKAAELAEHRLDEVRQAQFTTKDMADTLTRDLARVYGKDHLNVAVTEDGKSYACRRGDKPGTDLSAGERTTLSTPELSMDRSGVAWNSCERSTASTSSYPRLRPHGATVNPELPCQGKHTDASGAGCSQSGHLLVREPCSRSLLWFG